MWVVDVNDWYLLPGSCYPRYRARVRLTNSLKTKNKKTGKMQTEDVDCPQWTRKLVGADKQVMCSVKIKPLASVSHALKIVTPMLCYIF